MKIFIVLANIIVVYTICSSFIKRKVKEKALLNTVSIDIDTYVAYGNFIYSIVIAALITYALFDKSTKTLDSYSIILAILIIVLGLSKLITQRMFKPILTQDGILFYSGDYLLWDNVIEFDNKVDNNGDFVITIGGKVSTLNVPREKIIIPKSSSIQFERFIHSKLTFN